MALNIVGSAASASCLGHDNCSFIQVILAGQKSIHNLSYYDQGRITCVVVYIFQTNIYRLLGCIRQDLNVDSHALECRCKKIEMDRRHLRCKNCIVLLHLLGKFYSVDGTA